MPQSQLPSPALTFVVRSSGDGRAMTAALRDIVRTIDGADLSCGLGALRIE